MAFYVLNATVNNVIVSEGATTVSMASMLLGGIANIVLDSVMIFALGWGVAGAAIATLVGTLISFGAGFGRRIERSAQRKQSCHSNHFSQGFNENLGKRKS